MLNLYILGPAHTAIPPLPRAVASALNALSSPHLVNSYSSVKTQPQHHTFCEAIKYVYVFATWHQGPTLFIFLSSALIQWTQH